MGCTRRPLAALAVAAVVLAGCGDDDTSGGTTAPVDGELQPAEDANAKEDADGAVTGTIGEPARLVNEFGQDVTVTLRSVEVVDDAEQGHLLVVDVRPENATDDSQNAPEIELWCGEEQMAFYGGSYEWQEMPAGTFLEGTREFEYPDGCDAEVRAIGARRQWRVDPLAGRPVTVALAVLQRRA